MRLLYVCGTYAPGAHAGSELSAHTLLKRLSLRHHVDVLVASDIRYVDSKTRLGVFDGIQMVGVQQDEKADEIARTIQRFVPDVIYTQPWWHDVALRLGCKFKVPTIFRVVDWPIPDFVFKDHEIRPSAVVAMTKEVTQALARWSIRTVLLPAFIDLDRARSRNTKRREFITMFNPVKQKGGFLFRSIVAQMPTRAFGVVPGWSSLRTTEGSFDPELCRRAAESRGSPYNGWLPKAPNLSDLKNLRVFKPRENVWEIYDQTRILLAPSLWKEQFARVIFEAAANGAAVIASGMDSLKQNVGEAAMFVEDYRNVPAWMEAISQLDDADRYADRCKRGQEFVLQNYDLDRSVEDFYNLACDLV